VVDAEAIETGEQLRKYLASKEFFEKPTTFGPFYIRRVVDGDTLDIVGLENGVRVIGPGAPEMNWKTGNPEPFAEEAMQFVGKFAKDAGNKVSLTFDGPVRDKYQRYLAHVSVGERELTVELLESGLAKALLDFNYSPEYKERFRKAEQKAKDAKLGIWKGKK